MQLLRAITSLEKTARISVYLFALCLLFSIAGQFLFLIISSLSLLAILIIKLKGGARLNLRLEHFEWPILAVFVATALSLIFGAQFLPSDWGELLITTARCFLILYVFYYALESFSFEKKEKYVEIFILIALIVAVYAIFQFVTGVDILRYPNGPQTYGNFGYRTTGFFNGPMTYGHVFSMIVCASYGFLVYQSQVKGKIPYIHFLAFVLIFISVILTMTRGAYLGAAAGILSISLFGGRKVFISTLLLFAGIITIMIFSSTATYDRLVSIFSLERSSNASRLEIWRTYLLIFKDYPIFGYGEEHAYDALQQYYLKQNITNGQIGHAHNNFIHILGNTGIVGLLGYIYFFGYAMYFNIKCILKLLPGRSLSFHIALACLGAQVAFHVGGLSECTILDTEIRHVFFFALILPIISMKNYQSH